jgi:hypothetical protein
MMSFSAWQGYHEGGRRSAAKYNYRHISGPVAISRGISAWFVQECNRQECDGRLV